MSRHFVKLVGGHHQAYNDVAARCTGHVRSHLAVYKVGCSMHRGALLDQWRSLRSRMDRVWSMAGEGAVLRRTDRYVHSCSQHSLPSMSVA